MSARSGTGKRSALEATAVLDSGGAATHRETKLAGLDELRAVAVLLVMLYHQDILKFGWVGVQIFFVLSGFLISRSLHRTASLPIGDYLKVFYGRRTLRIFPLYYAMLAVLALILVVGGALPGVRAGIPFAATYSYNFWHASSSFQHSKFIAHFWSLSVEEQFYLVWPFVLFFCPKQHLRALLIGLVVAGPIIRLGLYHALASTQLPILSNHYVALYVLTPSHIDAFAVGAYVSLFPLGGIPRAAYAMFFVCVLAGLCCVLFSAGGPALNDVAPAGWASLGYPLGLSAGYGFVWGYSLINLSTALLIDCLVHGKLASGVFNNAPLRHIGKISYGFYLFHYPLQSIVAKVVHGKLWLQVPAQILLTTLVATAAYHWWEQPFLALKERWFSTSRVPSTSASPRG